MENNHPKNDQSGVVGAILLVGVLIAGAILLKDSQPPASNNNAAVPNNPSATAWQGRPVTISDHILGDPNARIVIVEYSDLECPFCKNFHNTMHQVVRERNDVAWVYRHYPIPSLHAKAMREAEATECAWEQGGNDAFWRFTDRIFEITPSNDGLTDTDLTNIAGFVGLDVNTFNNCLASGKYNQKVREDIDDGMATGVNGTPSSFILVDGKLAGTIPGAQPLEAIREQLRVIE